MRPSGYRIDDAHARDAAKRVARRRCPVSPGRRHQDRQRSTIVVQRCHQAGEHACADVLERQRRSMEQLQREDATLDFHERNWKLSASVDDRRQRPGSASRRRQMDATRDTPVSINVWLGSACQVGGRPRVDRLRHVQAAVSGKAIEQRGSKRDRRRHRRAAAVLTKRMSRRCARRRQRSPTRRSAAARDVSTTAAAIAAATRSRGRPLRGTARRATVPNRTIRRRGRRHRPPLA